MIEIGHTIDFCHLHASPIGIFHQLLVFYKSIRPKIDVENMFWLISDNLYDSYEKHFSSRHTVTYEILPDQKKYPSPSVFGIGMHSSCIVKPNCIELRSRDFSDKFSVVGINVFFKE